MRLYSRLLHGQAQLCRDASVTRLRAGRMGVAAVEFRATCRDASVTRLGGRGARHRPWKIPLYPAITPC